MIRKAATSDVKVIPAKGTKMVNFAKKPPTQVVTEAQHAYRRLLSNSMSILCGRNNSGKSFILRKLLTELGEDATYLGPQRYQNFAVLSPYGKRNIASLSKTLATLIKILTMQHSIFSRR